MHDEPEQEIQRGWQLAGQLVARVAAYRKQLGRLERILKSLGERWSDPKALDKSLGELGASRDGDLPLPPDLDRSIAELLAEGAGWLREEREDRRGRLGRQLAEGARDRGLSLAVVTKEPLEVRIAPLGVQIDLERARARLVFGQQEIAECPADAVEILEARDKALAGLDRAGWSPEGFHRQLREAWSEAAARAGQTEGWVELVGILPRLAFSIQTARWRLDPTPRNFTSYGKAQFLYELHCLRAASALSVDGWRLALGPATGTSTRDKRRVFWVEDGDGRGAYQLTLRFVRDEEIYGTQP